MSKKCVICKVEMKGMFFPVYVIDDKTAELMGNVHKVFPSIIKKQDICVFCKWHLANALIESVNSIRKPKVKKSERLVDKYLKFAKKWPVFSEVFEDE